MLGKYRPFDNLPIGIGYIFQKNFQCNDSTVYMAIMEGGLVGFRVLFDNE